MIVQDIFIYTIAGAVLEKTVIVPANVPNFSKKICEAIDNGGAMLDTIDGSKIIINTAAVVAVEIDEPREAEKKELSPPVEKSEVEF